MLKLFVVGESSGNPGEWRADGKRALVAASSADEAIALTDSCAPVAAELEVLQPGVLFTVDDSWIDE